MLICNSCHGGCCRNFGVGLTGYDILNISKILNLDPISFVQVLPVDKDIELQSKYSALFKFTDYNINYFYRFCLRMDKSMLVSETIKCMFLLECFANPLVLSEDKIIARCGIYTCRPLICRTFPSKLDPTEKMGIVFNPIVENTENKIYNLCPRTLTNDDLDNSSDEILKSLIMRKFEVDYFKNLAEYWNKNPGTISEFLIFMEKVYKKRVLVENVTE